MAFIAVSFIAFVMAFDAGGAGAAALFIAFMAPWVHSKLVPNAFFISFRVLGDGAAAIFVDCRRGFEDAGSLVKGFAPLRRATAGFFLSPGSPQCSLRQSMLEICRWAK